MEESLAPPRPTRWLGAIVCLILLVGIGWVTYVLTASRNGDSYGLVAIGSTVSLGSLPIPVEVAANLAQDGLTVKYLATSASVNQVGFVRKEHHSVKISVTAGKGSVAQDALTYVIFGSSGEKLSEGKVSLSSPLNAGATGEGEISDSEIPHAHRIVVGK